MTAGPLVVEVVRSGAPESEHLVDVAVVDPSGRLVAWAGDHERPAAYRSSAKPLQARASLEAGWEPTDARAVAIACSSHNGEAEHLAAVRSILDAAGIDETALRCPADVPLYLPAVMGVREKLPVYHNCSGKHAAMLAACTAAGWPLETYREPDHPLQQAVTALVRSAVGEISAALIDGCGVPTFVAPLRALARGLLAIDGGREAEAMRAHPFLVGGTDRLDTDLMAAVPNVLIKSGAEGLACLAVDGVGIALKARDGAARARGPAVLHVLEQLGVVHSDVLPQHRAPPVLG
ncbi:MAG TPA: asparaginase, partial [Actinomycetota bacterium]|nr:asparaginase [Actinomycetota bacterium]